MIFDALDHARLYEKLHPLFPKAFDYLRRFDPTHGKVALGRREFPGMPDTDMFVIVETYATEPPARRVYESHRRYIDLQYIVAGGETIYHAPVARLTTTLAYDPQKDVQFYSGADTHPIVLGPGDWTILYPHDGHKPHCHPALDPAAAAVEVYKVVVKIRV